MLSRPAPLNRLPSDSIAFLLMLERLTPAERDRLLDGFLRALKEGDLEGMVKLLARDATLYSDGGGKALTAMVNGRPGLLNLIGGHLLSVVSFEVEDGLIREIYIVLNPDKLARVPV